MLTSAKYLLHQNVQNIMIYKASEKLNEILLRIPRKSNRNNKLIKYHIYL